MENRILFQFNNVGKPYLLVKGYDNGNLTTLKNFEFNVDELENNLPIYEDIKDELDRLLNSNSIERNSATILINDRSMSKVTTTMPNINERKIRRIYEGNIVRNIPNLNTYDRYTSSSKVETGYIFYEFIYLKTIKEFFENLAKDLGFVTYTVNPFYTHLLNEAKKDNEEKTFAYFYEEKNIASLLVVVDGSLAAYHSFYAKDEEYKLSVASIIENHRKNLEKVDIAKVFANTEIDCFKDTSIEIRNYKIGE